VFEVPRFGVDVERVSGKGQTNILRALVDAELDVDPQLRICEPYVRTAFQSINVPTSVGHLSSSIKSYAEIHSY
jgi:hypothetical protein